MWRVSPRRMRSGKDRLEGSDKEAFVNPTLLLHWHYLIFLVPFGLAAALLLLSSLKLGHRHGTHTAHAHSGAHANVGHGPAVHAQSGHAPAHASTGTQGHPAPAHGRHHIAKAARHGEGGNVLLALLGVGRAPLPMVIQAFFLVWGLSGCLTIQILLGDTPAPDLLRMLPVMGVAAGCGLVGARVAAELIARLMPQEETCVVSREGLYGLKGSVAFPVTETAGRIIVYDDFGSLHDETCRVTPGHPTIERGRQVMVMDRDASGYLLVEEVPD